MHPQRLAYAARFQSQIKYRLTNHSRRFLRTSPQQHTLVGPPDPISNLRPVIYDEVGPVPSGRRRKGKEREDGENLMNTGKDVAGPSTSIIERTRTSPTHPYLLDEFDGDPVDYQWRIERSRLDAYNHAYWKDSNTRFETAKQSIVSSLPDSASPEAREAALSEFYGKWLQQEQERSREYSDEWSRRNFGGIVLAARAAIRQFRTRIFGSSLPRPGSISTSQSEGEHRK